MTEEFDKTHLVYMTVGTSEEARRLARTVVGEKLAACANIISGVTSVYEWEGKIHEDPEQVVILKTSASKVKSLVDRLVEQHSYECPCVVSTPLADGYPAFLSWVGAQTKAE